MVTPTPSGRAGITSFARCSRTVVATSITCSPSARIDLDEYSGMVLMPDNQVGFLKTVANLGDIAKAQRPYRHCLLRRRSLRNPVGRSSGRGSGPAPGIPGYRYCRQTSPVNCDGSCMGDVGECQAKGPQSMERYLDGDFVFPNAADVDLGNGGKRRELHPRSDTPVPSAQRSDTSP